MSQPDALDRVTAVFTEYMEPNDNGDPVVDAGQFPEMLEVLGLPAAVPPPTIDDEGNIAFDLFIEKIYPLVEQMGATPSQEDIEAQRNTFYMLSNGEDTITAERLRAVIKPLGLLIPDEDISKMCAEPVDKTRFIQLWQRFVRNN